MYLLGVLAGLMQPTPDCAFVQPKGSYDRLHWTAVTQQRHHQHKEFAGLLDAIQTRAMCFTKGLATALALVPLLLLTMHNDITATLLAAGVKAHIRAKLCLRVHLASPLLS